VFSIKSLAILVFGTLFGVVLSIPLARKISDQKFNFAVNLLLAFISVKVLFEGVRELFFSA
jgi:uncharacterized membrane protein YfcA